MLKLMGKKILTIFKLEAVMALGGFGGCLLLGSDSVVVTSLFVAAPMCFFLYFFAWSLGL